MTAKKSFFEAAQKSPKETKYKSLIFWFSDHIRWLFWIKIPFFVKKKKTQDLQFNTTVWNRFIFQAVHAKKH